MNYYDWEYHKDFDLTLPNGKRRKFVPRATDTEEARELSVDGSDLYSIIIELLGYGIYVGLAARANGHCSITARKDSRVGKWDFSPAEDPQEVVEQLLADVLKPKKR